MSETLVTELLRYCKSTYGIDLCSSSGAKDVFRAELCLLKSLVCLGRSAMQSWFKQIGKGHKGQRAEKKGVQYRFVGYRPKTVHGLFGVITYRRAYYVTGTGKGWAPLDEQLGIKLRHTPGCQYFLSNFSARQPYAESLGQFHEVFRADGVDLISTKKAYEMVCEVSAGLEDQRQREIKEDQEDQEDQEDKPLAVREKITGTMVVGIDAGKVPTRANERVDDDGNKNYDREYRDAKVATVSALEWDEKRAEAHCTKTSSVTGIEHADQFFPRIEVEMKRRSAELGTLILVVLGDGASWIWDRVADLAEPGQQVWYILDFWHACDHLAKICRVLYGEDTKPFTKQFKRWRRMLRKSGVAAVISELKQLRDSGSYPGAGDDIQKQINYFTTNKERMDYQRNRELRLPIGSGTVETACKNVVAARLKQSGMMWSVDGAKGMLQLRASLKSRRLMSDFDSLLPLSPTQETDLKAA